MTKHGEHSHQGRQQLGVPLLLSLALLSASAPFSIDMYLPALPGIAADLGTTPAMVQLTLSGFLAGLAVGQLIIGPISDAVGRRKLMLGGAAVALVAAIIAAVAPSITVLIVARLVQGVGSGACVVLSRAVIPDLAKGPAAARAFSLLMSIQGVAPILAPVAGGLLLEPIGWRGLFFVLAGIAVAQLLVVVFAIRESKPPEERSPATVRGIVGNYAYVIRNAGYRGYLVSFAFGFSALFCYIAASPFLFQEQLGFSAQSYALLFAINGGGIIAGNVINGRLVGRVNTQLILFIALAILISASALLLLVVTLKPLTPLIVGLLFISVAQVGVIMGNSTALGTGLVRARAGSASALMGFAQFGLAGSMSPLMGLGENPGLNMAIGMLVCSLIALGGVVYAGRNTTAGPTSVS
ncbi:multidrug effflux MFS transporter [Corynebacterium atrinae]|uniref:multidrug effflux MFS transporter n=1 Tax=Corynebacterium atrinae TaxID=1336740 RepID=UPI0025B50BA1|nr:multidrug effflux MFS transporter [Corynebacterium atrinae]